MTNLGAAQCLNSLELHNGYPSNFRPASWPREMPCLQNIKLIGFGHVSPQWIAYSRLQCLSLGCCTEAYLPEWFSGMTQLKSLSFFDCLLQQLSNSVLQLTQLENLILANNVPAFVFSGTVLCMASWPHLQSFILKADSLESKMILLELKQRLQHFNPNCSMPLE